MDSTQAAPDSTPMNRRSFLSAAAVAAGARTVAGVPSLPTDSELAVNPTTPAELDGSPGGAASKQATPAIKGYVKPGLESVRDTFAANARLMGTGGAAFAATHQGELVVDLWAGMADHDRPWLRNTRVHVQSTSKAVTAATAMMLHDRGELDLDAPVGGYWPEYATNGKENTTVRMLLSHAAGSTQLPGYTDLLDLDGNGFDQYDEIARRLAAAEPDWEPGTAHAYHGYTYGNLVSEVVYRISGKRAGAFLRDEMAGPWQLNTWLGTPYEEQRDLAAVKPWPEAPVHESVAEMYASVTEQMAEMALPALTDPSTWQYHAAFRGLLGGPMDVFMLQVGRLWSQPKALAAEFGAANVTTDARSLARLYTPLAMDGVLDGRQVLEPATVREFTTPSPPGGVDLLIGREQKWTPGSHHANAAFFPGLPPIYGPNPDAFGMSGGGGNYGFADPAAGIAGGFVRNHYSNTMGLSALLVEALYGAM